MNATAHIIYTMCPVCGGRTVMPPGFYPDRKPMDANEWVDCRSCGGNGYLIVESSPGVVKEGGEEDEE